MKRTKLSESQIIAMLNEAEAGMLVDDVCRKHGVSPATYPFLDCPCKPSIFKTV